MYKVRWMQKVLVLLSIGVIGWVSVVKGQETDSLKKKPSPRFIHGLSVEERPEYIFPTHPFLRGDNPERKIIRGASSIHLKYAFRYRPGGDYDRIYGGVYQGLGLGYYNFGASEQIGNPLAIYLFQGARIARVCSWLSFNYEWNFGLSSGWKPYDASDNSYNKMVGSKINAYIDANFYFQWILSPRVSLTSGITLTHFSNGNTSFPNAGLNTIGGKFGVEYNFYRKENPRLSAPASSLNPTFQRHVSYDFVFFGSWRRKGIWVEDGQLPSPESYPVFGFNFAPMYNLDYKLRLGLSLDGVYDGSANLYTEEGVYGGIDGSQIRRPALYQQFALGLSGRVEYVMPFFTVGVGIGKNFIGKGDLRALYQMLTLKIALSRDTFLHVGYNLQDFHEPNFLMLGVGFRFNSKYAAF